MWFVQILNLLSCFRSRDLRLARLNRQKKEPFKTLSIYATDIWSEKVKEAKYERRNAKNNIIRCKVENVTTTAYANMNMMRILMQYLIVLVFYLFFILLFFFSVHLSSATPVSLGLAILVFLKLTTLIHSSQLGFP